MDRILKEALAQTQRDLSAAQILVRDLSNRRLQLRKDLNSAAAISSLPRDLKHKIFLTVNDDDGWNRRMPVLSLAVVCAEWRQIVLDIPELWSKIYLSFSYEETCVTLSLVEDYLERGGQVPLYVTLELLRYEGGRGQGWPSQDLFLDLLSDHSKRWRHISLRRVKPQHFKLNMLRQQGDLPLLHSLEIFGPDGCDPHEYADDPKEPLFECSAFLHAPSLREVCINAYTLEEIILPWHQLEKLDARGHAINVYHTLSMSHNLLKCKLHIGDRDDEFIPQNITLPKLQTLTLSGGDVGDCNLVKYLHVPALKDYRHSLHNRYDFDALSGLINRSSCHLNVLHVKAVMMNDDFLRCIQLLSSLVELELSLYKYDESMDHVFDVLRLPNNFISSLNPDTDKHTLLPNLEIFKYDGLTDFNFKTLLEMLCRRGRRGSSAVSQITRLSIRSRNAIPGFDDASMKELGSLREEGIEIEIRAGPFTIIKGRPTWQNNFLSTNGLEVVGVGTNNVC